MIIRAFGPASRAGHLKGVLNSASQNIRQISHKIANATTPEAGGFEAAMAAAQQQVDLEKQMVHLANEQLRFEASANLLRKHNAQLRTAMGRSQ